MAQSDRTGRGPSVLRGYLPLIIGAVLFVGMVLVIPSEVPENGGSADGPAPEEGEAGTTASGFGETVELCEDRELQAESVYSPPCFTFTGDNGGETSVGVTADAIDVSYRYLQDGHLLATLGSLAGIDIDEDAEDLYRTVEGLVDYFNQNFEFYGRQINLERYEAVGSSTLELSGGGRDLAQTDALTAVQNGSFADVGNGLATSQVYSEILASEGIVTIGAAYMSREWFDARGPHAWSMFPDCTRVAEVNAEVGISRLLAEPAVLAGGDLEGQPRRMGIIHPNQAEYTQCADLAIGIIEDAGFEPLVQNYTIDLAATESTAASIMAQLRDNDITSVACACDPLMQRALAVLAEQQGYYPEWLIQGVGYIDIDLVGQMIAATAGSQWDRAFGGSPTAAMPAWGTSEGYLAYTSVRDDQPSRTVDILYGQLYRLAIGIQMAGPDLTADNFATGMYNYPGGSGFLGAWDFSPGNHTGVTDLRMIRWRGDLPSTFNGEPGTYYDNGVRFTDPEDLPTQDELLGELGAG